VGGRGATGIAVQHNTTNTSVALVAFDRNGKACVIGYTS
jgi:hypothetical protein